MDFERIWEDLQARASAVLDKSHVLAKYVALVAITVFAFSLRIVGFVRVRGTHELEDIFNLAMTDKLSSAGVSTFFHDSSSLPEGSVLYPGLMAFVQTMQCLLSYAGVVLSVQTLYTLAGPFFASCTAVATYFLGKELKDETTGLVAAAILSLLPGFFAVSVDGRYGNVVGGTFFTVLVALFFIKAIKSQEQAKGKDRSSGTTYSLVQALLAGIAYFLLSSFWCGYVFVQALLSAYVVLLLLTNKGASVHTVYTVFFIVGNVLNVLLPVGGFFPFLHVDFVPGAAVLVLLQLSTFVPFSTSILASVVLLATVVMAVGASVGILTPSSAFSVFWAQFASGNGSNWLTFFRDLHLVLFLVPAGVFLCFRKRSAVNIFLIAYALVGILFASVSGSFISSFFPVASLLASLGLTSTFKTYLRNQDAPVKKGNNKVLSKEVNVAALAGMAALVGFFLVYSFSAATHPTVYQPATVFPAVSQSSNEFLWVDDLREAVGWLQHNTKNDSRVVTWKGLGQQVANIARQSALGSDAATTAKNLGLVGKFFQVDERTASGIATELNAQYALVIFGGASGFPADDIAHSYEISRDGQHFSEQSVLIKLSYKGFAELTTRPSDQPGFDLARQQPISLRPTLTHFAEVFTSEHWLVRIYELVNEPAQEEEEDVE